MSLRNANQDSPEEVTTGIQYFFDSSFAFCMGGGHLRPLAVAANTPARTVACSLVRDYVYGTDHNSLRETNQDFGLLTSLKEFKTGAASMKGIKHLCVVDKFGTKGLLPSFVAQRI